MSSQVNTKPKRVTKRKKNTTAFHRDIYKVLKQIYATMGMRKDAHNVIESIVQDLLSRLQSETYTIIEKCGKKTVTARDIQAAVRLALPGELGKHAVAEGTRAVTKFASSNDKKSSQK